MKDFNYYKTTSNTYPCAADYTTYYVYNKGKTIWQGSYKEYKKNKDVTFPKGCVVQTSVDKEAFNNHAKKYREENNKLMQEFKEDLFEEFGVSQNPKRELCYLFAWEEEHASGLESVYDRFSDFVQLIK